MVPALRVLLLAAALALVACVPSDRPTGGEIALGVRVEQVRAHLGAAGGNAASPNGRTLALSSNARQRTDMDIVLVDARTGAQRALLTAPA